LGRHHAAVLQQRRIGAEEKILHLFAVRRHPVDRQVRLRVFLLVPAALDIAHHRQHRHLALPVLIHADTEIHLLRILVGDEGLGQAKDGIGGGECDVGERRSCHGY
jgi:hypothetical protein